MRHSGPGSTALPGVSSRLRRHSALRRIRRWDGVRCAAALGQRPLCRHSSHVECCRLARGVSGVLGVAANEKSPKPCAGCMTKLRCNKLLLGTIKRIRGDDAARTKFPNLAWSCAVTYLSMNAAAARTEASALRGSFFSRMFRLWGEHHQRAADFGISSL